MKTIERDVFKLLTGSISTTEFEKNLYQEENIAKIQTNQFIYDLIDINYREESFLNKVRLVAEQHFNITDFLLIELRFYCLKIIESENIDDITNIISKYSILYYQENCNLRVFEYFLNANSYLNLINDNIEFYSKNEILNNTKKFARAYLEAFDLKKTNEELINFTTSKFLKEQLTYVLEEDVLNFMSDKKTEFVTNNRIKGIYKSAGFKDAYIQNVLDKIERTTISKLTTRVFIYTAIGIPFLYVGIKALEKEHVLPLIWFVGFSGLILLTFSVVYIFQILVLIKKHWSR